MKKIFFATIIIILLIVGGFTAYKVMKNYNEKAMLVTSKRIEEAALRCFNEKKCLESKITLKTLYDLDYLEREVNPVTKEYYDDGLFVEIKEGKANFKS